MTADILYATGFAFGIVALMGLAMYARCGWLLTLFIWRA